LSVEVDCARQILGKVFLPVRERKNPSPSGVDHHAKAEGNGQATKKASAEWRPFRHPENDD
jgi:hypothetical protein